MIKICPQCGKGNPDNSVFCIYCGQNLSGVGVKPFAQSASGVGVKDSGVHVKPGGGRAAQPYQPQVSAPIRPSRISPPGMCFYHNQIPAVYVCARCGRSICKDCAKNHSGMVFCVQCAPR
ncbi:MAG: zinc-ribbon domain-containing protein [Theionarchaea archaeon]|nr:zinc-ribbon domain-containing protein [Theionarchaea archaeon]